MAVSPLAEIRPGSVPEIDAGAVRPAQVSPVPVPAGSSAGKSAQQQGTPATAAVPQDVVKVQLEPPGEIVVYQFVDQHGTVVLQVPPRQLLELAKQISQELQAKVPVQTSAEGGKSDGR
jgi:hypothetical protein